MQICITCKNKCVYCFNCNICISLSKAQPIRTSSEVHENNAYLWKTEVSSLIYPSNYSFLYEPSIAVFSRPAAGWVKLNQTLGYIFSYCGLFTPMYALYYLMAQLHPFDEVIFLLLTVMHWITWPALLLLSFFFFAKGTFNDTAFFLKLYPQL